MTTTQDTLIAALVRDDLAGAAEAALWQVLHEDAVPGAWLLNALLMAAGREPGNWDEHCRDEAEAMLGYK